jgi:hypothetical protein
VWRKVTSEPLGLSRRGDRSLVEYVGFLANSPADILDKGVAIGKHPKRSKDG